jgi:hypothetical protein
MVSTIEIYYDNNYEMWMAKNIRFDFPHKEAVEIEDELDRYDKKSNINRSDAEFQNLIDRIVERRRDEELFKATSLLLKFGGVRDKQMEQEQNLFKKKSLYAGIFHYYNQALEIGAKFIDDNKLKARIKELE